MEHKDIEYLQMALRLGWAAIKELADFSDYSHEIRDDYFKMTQKLGEMLCVNFDDVTD